MALTTRSPKRSSSQPVHVPEPEMRVTQYDRVSSLMIAVIVALIIAVGWLFMVWLTNRIPKEDENIPLELLEIPGGSEDGAPDETLEVESPEDVTDDPSLADLPSDETEVSEMVDTVVEFSENASQIMPQQFQTDPQNTGNPGSATGTGRRPLGMGNGKAGMPREQRWFVRFSDRGSLDDYARQLDQFGIELGLHQGNTITLLSNLSKGSPTKRVLTSGKERSNWLYFTWRGGNRKDADVKLFKKAGVTVSTGTIFHFYPQKTEQQMAQLERAYANKPSAHIRRTYFVVQPGGGGYQFVVTRQFYLR